jgi:hypothetical protein
MNVEMAARPGPYRAPVATVHFPLPYCCHAAEVWGGTGRNGTAPEGFDVYR